MGVMEHGLAMRILVIGLMLTGCTTTSRIVPIGENIYQVSAARYFCSHCVPPINQAMAAAYAYCNKAGKMGFRRGLKEQSGFGHRVTVSFVCDCDPME
jgi:hypothetical protein